MVPLDAAGESKAGEGAAGGGAGAGAGAGAGVEVGADGVPREGVGGEAAKRMLAAKAKRSTWKKYFSCCLPRPTIDVSGPAMEAVEMLRLTTNDLQHLYDQFKIIDFDGSGFIDSNELLDVLNQPPGPFTKALFGIMDVDGSGQISFSEFVHVCATYCMYSQDDILDFCFNIFDTDQSGWLDEEEFIQLAACVSDNTPMFPGNFRMFLEQFDVNQDGVIDFQEFAIINHRYPLVFFPAFRMQLALQEFTLGSAYWAKIMERKQFMRMVQKHREANGGRFPKEPLRAKVKRWLTCGENKYSPESIAFVAGMKARKHTRFRPEIAPPPKPRVHRVGPRPKNLVRLDNYNAKQKRLAEKKKTKEGGVSSRSRS